MFGGLISRSGMNEGKDEMTDRVSERRGGRFLRRWGFELTTEANEMKVSETTEQLVGVHLAMRRGARVSGELFGDEGASVGGRDGERTLTSKPGMVCLSVL